MRGGNTYNHEDGGPKGALTSSEEALLASQHRLGHDPREESENIIVFAELEHSKDPRQSKKSKNNHCSASTIMMATRLDNSKEAATQPMNQSMPTIIPKIA